MHTWWIIFTTHMLNKGLTSTICKEVLGINKKGVEKLGTWFSGKATHLAYVKSWVWAQDHNKKKKANTYFNRERKH